MFGRREIGSGAVREVETHRQQEKNCIRSIFRDFILHSKSYQSAGDASSVVTIYLQLCY